MDRFGADLGSILFQFGLDVEPSWGRAGCGMQRASCSAQLCSGARAACNVQRAAVRRAAHSRAAGGVNVQRAACNGRRAACNVQRAACSVRRCSVRRATRSRAAVQRAACSGVQRRTCARGDGARTERGLHAASARARGKNAGERVIWIPPHPRLRGIGASAAKTSSKDSESNAKKPVR